MLPSSTNNQERRALVARTSPIETDCEVASKAIDPRFGEVHILRSKTRQAFYAVQGFSFKDREVAEEFMSRVERRMSYPAQLFLPLIDFSLEETSKFFSKGFLFKLFYEYPMSDLDRESIERQRTCRRFLPQELSYILTRGLQALRFLEEQKTWHGDLRLHHFSTNKSNGEIRLMDRFDLLGSKDQVLRIQTSYLSNGETVYLPPEAFNNLFCRPSGFDIDLNVPKNDIFALGLLVLELGLSSSIQKIYYNTDKILMDKLNSFVVEFSRIYSAAAPQLVFGVSQCLLPSAMERPSASLLLTKMSEVQAPRPAAPRSPSPTPNQTTVNRSLSRNGSGVNFVVQRPEPQRNGFQVPLHPQPSTPVRVQASGFPMVFRPPTNTSPLTSIVPVSTVGMTPKSSIVAESVRPSLSPRPKSPQTSERIAFSPIPSSRIVQNVTITDQFDPDEQFRHVLATQPSLLIEKIEYNFVSDTETKVTRQRTFMTRENPKGETEVFYSEILPTGDREIFKKFVAEKEKSFWMKPENRDRPFSPLHSRIASNSIGNEETFLKEVNRNQPNFTSFSRQGSQPQLGYHQMVQQANTQPTYPGPSEVSSRSPSISSPRPSQQAPIYIERRSSPSMKSPQEVRLGAQFDHTPSPSLANQPPVVQPQAPEKPSQAPVQTQTQTQTQPTPAVAPALVHPLQAMPIKIQVIEQIHQDGSMRMTGARIVALNQSNDNLSGSVGLEGSSLENSVYQVGLDAMIHNMVDNLFKEALTSV